MVLNSLCQGRALLCTAGPGWLLGSTYLIIYPHSLPEHIHPVVCISLSTSIPAGSSLDRTCTERGSRGGGVDLYFRNGPHAAVKGVQQTPIYILKSLAFLKSHSPVSTLHSWLELLVLCMFQNFSLPWSLTYPYLSAIYLGINLLFNLFTWVYIYMHSGLLSWLFLTSIIWRATRQQLTLRGHSYLKGFIWNLEEECSWERHVQSMTQFRLFCRNKTALPGSFPWRRGATLHHA